MTKLETQSAARRKLMSAARAAPPCFARDGTRLPPAFFLTDPRRTSDPAAIADRLPAGWGVVYRHYGEPDRFKIGKELAGVCQRRMLVLLVSADPYLARRIEAAGLHWPERWLNQSFFRKPGWIVSASAHSRSALARASARQVDLVFRSAVFPGASPSAAAAMGGLLFRQAARDAPLPVYALGGVGPKNAAGVFARNGASAGGWAAIDSIVRAWG
ncbi:MAG: thiamine phosphate synthase [Alphaproteobacteria bacterium]|nr:thiamine phosphate synthase [Alphaproteobacteria bacterium]